MGIFYHTALLEKWPLSPFTFQEVADVDTVEALFVLRPSLAP